MKTKIFLSLFAVFASFSFLSAQQIGDGKAPMVGENAFNNRLGSGFYGTESAQAGYPSISWPHPYRFLINVAERDQTNYTSFQISSSYSTDDRVFFRKINPWMSERNWYELATRGSNTFTGTQIVQGNGAMVSVGHALNTDRLTMAYWGEPNQGSGFISYPRNLFLGPDGQPNSTQVHFNNLGHVGIGCSAGSDYKLSVKGSIRAYEIVVETGWADFVFAKDYQLPTLTEVKAHIDEHKHLPGIPSEAEVKENGVGLAEMTTKLLQKVEELTLYAIQQQEKATEQQKTIEVLSKKIEELENSKK